MENPDPTSRTPVGRPDGDAAMGGTTIMEVINEAQGAGYTSQFIACEHGQVRCSSCDQVTNPAALHVDRSRRLEGASDAADELLVVLATCPRCGANGVLTLGYGPNASDEDIAVLPHLSIDPATAAPPPE